MFDVKKAAAEQQGAIQASTITRLLVVSFFIALSLGLIDGADIKLLATPFLPEDIATQLMRGLVLALSVMVLVGFHRKRAALILALIVFWPAYISLYAGGDVSAFWRDLALIGALIMTASESQNGQSDAATEHPVEVVTFTPEPETDKPGMADDAYREDFKVAQSV